MFVLPESLPVMNEPNRPLLIKPKWLSVAPFGLPVVPLFEKKNGKLFFNISSAAKEFLKCLFYCKQDETWIVHFNLRIVALLRRRSVLGHLIERPRALVGLLVRHERTV